MGLTSLTDLGIAGTLTKHVAEFLARGDGQALNHIVNSSMMLYIAISLVLAGTHCLGAHVLIPSLFRNTGISEPDLRLLWYLFACIVVTNVLTMPFYSIVNGLQRMDITNEL